MKWVALPLVCVIGLGCASPKRGQVLKTVCNSVVIEYGGGDGSSCEEAVIISGPSDIREGASAEDIWLRSHHPNFVRVGGSIEYPFCVRDCEKIEPRVWERAKLRGPDGREVEVCFDVTSFHGKRQ